MDHFVEVAIANSCSRLERTTDRDNVQAQRFYDRKGVAQNSKMIFYRFEGQLLRATGIR
ncbi:hypothetical protein [Plantactinospora sp. DSM 117369]